MPAVRSQVTMKTLIVSLLLCVIARMTLAERTNAVAASGAELENRLRAIVFPEMEFSNVDVCDILEFCWASLDPTPDKNWRSLGLVNNSYATNDLSKRPRAILLPADDPELRIFSKITIKMRYASVMDLLDRVAKETGFTVTVGSTNLLIKTGTGRVIMNKSIDPSVDGTGRPARNAERPSPAPTSPHTPKLPSSPTRPLPNNSTTQQLNNPYSFSLSVFTNRAATLFHLDALMSPPYASFAA